jgi:hypothetical protein
LSESQGGRPAKEYSLTLDMSKEGAAGDGPFRAWVRAHATSRLYPNHRERWNPVQGYVLAVQATDAHMALEALQTLLQGETALPPPAGAGGMLFGGDFRG